MEAKETSFTFMLSTMSIEIPFFQRGYVWDQNNWDDLLQNLLDNKQSHFLGSIILKHIKTPSGDPPRWSVIDGQQRLTTLSILMRACYETIPFEQNGDMEVKADAESRLKTALFYKFSSLSSKQHIKIKHSMVDSPVYEQVVRGNVELDQIRLKSEADKGEQPSAGIFQCYKYFKLKLSDDPESAKRIWNLLLNDNIKILVKIDLGDDENEQAIFDTVNTAGVRLTCSDTIKNALFQKLIEISDNDTGKQEVIELYKETWEKTFACDGETIDYWAAQQSLGRIMRDRLEILLHAVALINRFYDPTVNRIAELSDLYKKYISMMDKASLMSFIKEICSYGVIYNKFFKQFTSSTLFSYSNHLQRLFHVLDVCDVSTFHAYILMLLKEHKVQDEDELPDVFIKEIYDIERLVIRHVLCGVTMKNFNKDCMDLISGNQTTEGMLKEKDQELSDEKIKESLRKMGSNKIATLLLFWIELYRRSNDNKHDVELKYNFSLEHVMPQSWEKYWPVTSPCVVDTNTCEHIDDEEKAAAARRSAIYEIGNMILLMSSLNASLHNYELSRKIKGEGRKRGIEHYASNLSITWDILNACSQTYIWNEKLIRDRTDMLADEVLKIW